MQIAIKSPDGREGVAVHEDGPIIEVTGSVSLDDIKADIQFLRPNSATGVVNDVGADWCFVLRSAELCGWWVDWPDVDADGDEDYDGDEAVTMDVN